MLYTIYRIWYYFGSIRYDDPRQQLLCLTTFGFGMNMCTSPWGLLSQSVKPESVTHDSVSTYLFRTLSTAWAIPSCFKKKSHIVFTITMPFTILFYHNSKLGLLIKGWNRILIMYTTPYAPLKGHLYSTMSTGTLDISLTKWKSERRQALPYFQITSCICP